MTDKYSGDTSDNKKNKSAQEGGRQDEAVYHIDDIDEADVPLLDAIIESLGDINLGFDFKVLDVLEDEKATPAKIEALKEQFGTVVSARLFSIANSVHYGKIRSGKITKFIDVVKHLGTETTKSTAIFIALLALAKTEQLKAIFARNYATSKLTEVFAGHLGLRGNEKSTAVLGGLFIEMGKVIILLYADKQQQIIEDNFIEKYYPYIGSKVIETFELPESLDRIVNHNYFSFAKKESLALSAIVDMAHAVVDESFRKHGKLVVQSVMPDPEGILYSSTIGSILIEQFQTMGLSTYLQVIDAELSAQERRTFERQSGEESQG